MATEGDSEMPRFVEGDSGSPKRSFGVGFSTSMVLGGIAGLFLATGVGALFSRAVAPGLFFLGIAGFVFTRYCLQKIEFEGGTMKVVRPFSRAQCVALAKITRVSIRLISQGRGFHWEGKIFGGDSLLCQFNPKLFSFEALDFMCQEIRTYSPNVSIENQADLFRIKRKK